MLPTSELEQTLEQLIIAHTDLAQTLSIHTKAMSAMNLPEMERMASVCQRQRQNLAVLENRRMQLMQPLVRHLQLPAKATLRELAEAVPARKAQLLALRERLAHAVQSVHTSGVVASRISGAVVGHLNTALRLLSIAVKQGGTYNRSGNSPSPGRLGLVEAVG
jgi:FlgN protein